MRTRIALIIIDEQINLIKSFSQMNEERCLVSKVHNFNDDTTKALVQMCPSSTTLEPIGEIPSKLRTSMTYKREKMKWRYDTPGVKVKKREKACQNKSKRPTLVSNLYFSWSLT